MLFSLSGLSNGNDGKKKSNQPSGYDLDFHLTTLRQTRQIQTVRNDRNGDSTYTQVGGGFK